MDDLAQLAANLQTSKEHALECCKRYHYRTYHSARRWAKPRLDRDGMIAECLAHTDELGWLPDDGERE